MIFITGDVHTYKGHIYDQQVSGPELITAQRYLRILKKYDLPCTLFVNGISFYKKTEKEQIKKLLNYDVELGGHTFNNFGIKKPIAYHKFKVYIKKRIYRCVYGSESFQRKDIKKTKKAFEKFGLKMNSWRTHAFESNESTFKILKENKVKYVSDLTGGIRPFFKEVIHMPINIPVDQNTISYGINRPESRDLRGSCLKSRIRPEEWFDILKKRVISNEKNKIPSIILIHPTTMHILDNFKLFEEVAKFLSKYECYKISEFKL
jgi:peptidoglycan/xylan/chitin deacetylase (PgdA/CDA1 family)